MSAELERRVKRLEKELARIKAKPAGGISSGGSGLSNPPTGAQLDTLFGIAGFGSTLYDGFSTVLRDTDNTLVYWLAYNNGSWYYVLMTQAV